MSDVRRTNVWVISDSEDDSCTEIQCPNQNTRNNADRPRSSLDPEHADRLRSSLDPEHADRLRSSLDPEHAVRSSSLNPKHVQSAPTDLTSGPAADAQSPKRQRGTNKDTREDAVKTQEKREAREKQKAIRAKEKQEKRQEQQKRREAAEHVKSLMPEHCLKRLSVCIDPALLQFDGSDILLGTLEAFQWKFSIEKQGLPQSIGWTRDLLQEQGDDGSVEEDQVLMVMDLPDFIDIVIGVRKMLENPGDAPTAYSLLSSLLEFLDRHGNKVVTILVMGSPANRSKAWDTTRLLSQMGLDGLDIEEVLVYLQLYRNICLSFTPGWQEVTDHVSAVTKALSKRPSKALAERTELPFCVDAAWASGVRVERDGSGLAQVWLRQVQQLNRVSTAIATAVTGAHRSPRLLLQAYQSADTEAARRGLLAGLVVRGEGKERRLGPELSSRVYRSLTAQNPELVLD